MYTCIVVPNLLCAKCRFVKNALEHNFYFDSLLSLISRASRFHPRSVIPVPKSKLFNV